MHVLRILPLSVLCGWAIALAETPANTTSGTADTNRAVIVELTDGSRLFGTPSLQALPFSNALGVLTIPLAQVAHVDGTFSQTNLVAMINGDRLSGTPTWETMRLNTIFGTVSIGRSNILQLSVLTGKGNLPASLRDGLLLHYIFDTHDSGTIPDNSGQHCAGSYYDADWGTSLGMGGLLVCNGANTRVEFSAETFPTGTAPRTLAAWVCQDTVTGGRFYVFGYGGNPRGSEFRLALNEFTPGQFSLETGAGGWHADISLKPRCWYHLAIAYDGGRTPRFYVNGNEVAIAGTWTSPLIRTLAEGGALGMRRNQEGGGYLKGQIAEVAAWQRALRSEEFRTLYQLRPSADYANGVTN
jgi:hypothetical protein